MSDDRVSMGFCLVTISSAIFPPSEIRVTISFTLPFRLYTTPSIADEEDFCLGMAPCSSYAVT